MTLATTYHGLIAPDHVPPEVELTAHEQEGLDALIAHFGHENYVLPLKEGSQEKAGLTDAEMMFLVSHLAVECVARHSY
jgi:hypothetical protein